MKIKDIAKKYSFDSDALEKWLHKSDFKCSDPFFSLDRIVDDGQNIDEIANSYRQFQAQEQERIAREKTGRENQIASEQEEQIKMRDAMASMLITSGFNFDGYTITKYSGYISGDDAVQCDRPTKGWLGGMSSNVGEDLLAGLGQIRRNALAELKEAAYALGCNAVIGVDFDYLTLDPETVTPNGGTLYLPFLFAVTANGNAVVIEKK
jgi:uncharacterized protein YbjQ (UPF0145 family)